MRISDWSSDVCSSDLDRRPAPRSRGPDRDRDGGAGRMTLQIAGRAFDSHLLLGSGGLPNAALLAPIIEAAEPALVTVSMRRTSSQIGRASCRERGGQYV